MAALTAMIATALAAPAALIGPPIAKTVIAENARKDAKRASNRQLELQQQQLVEQKERTALIAGQRQDAAERDARISRSRATRARRAGLGKAGQGSTALLGSPLAAGQTTGGKTLLGL